jgi:peptidoglycan/LPS O-acetylase OafA/YrhL
LRFLHWSSNSVTQFSVSRIPAIAFVTFTQNFWMAWLGTFGVGCMAATWSLAVEEQFYLSAPFLVRKVSRERLVQILLAVVCIAPLLRILLCLIMSTGRNAAYVLMPCRADALSLGVLVAVVVRSQSWWDILLQNRKTLRKFGWVILAGLLPLNVFGSAMSLPMATVGYSWLAISYAWLLVIVISRANKTLNRILSERILRTTGVLAYSTYLLHLPMMAAFERILDRRFPDASEPTHLATRIIAVAVTVGLAALSWRFFEGPLLRRAHKFTY